MHPPTSTTRDSLRNTLHQNKKFLNEWEQQQKDSHKEALRKRRLNEKKELEFELTMKERRAKKREMKLKNTLNDFQSSIQAFENRLSTTNTSKPPQLKDPKAFISKIKTKKQTEIMARKDRDQRRRKMLLDQQKMMDSLQQQRRRDLRLKTLRQESREERDMVKRLAETMKWKTVMRRNREFRQQQYEEQQKKDEQLKKESTQLERQKREQERQQQHELLLQRFQERQQQKAQKKSKKNEVLCEKVVHQLVALAEKEIDYKELTEGETPKEHERNEWKQAFIKDLAIEEDKPSTQKSNDATNQDETQSTSDGEETQSSDDAALKESPEVSQLLDERQFEDYTLNRNMWTPAEQETPQEESKEEENGEQENEQSPIPLLQNDHLAQALTTIETIINPPPAQASENPFKSRCAVRLSISGKPFSGVSRCAKELAKEFSLAVIAPDEILQRAMGPGSSPHGDELLTKISKQLLSGTCVDDTLMAQLIVREIKQAEEDESVRGWIIDGYPNTEQCALELEKQLAGFQEKTYRPKKSSLLEYNIEDYSDRKHPFTSFSQVIFLNVSNGAVFERVTGQRFDVETQTFYHMTYNPPPEEEEVLSRLQSIEEVQIDRTQINDQITSFSKNQQKIEQFYKKDCTTPVLNINADEELDTVLGHLRSVVEKQLEEEQPQEQPEEPASDETNNDEPTDEEGEQQPEQEETPELTPEEVEQQLQEEEDSIKQKLQLKPETAELLDRLWYSMENQYADSVKSVFNQLRRHRRLFLHRLHLVKNKFIAHLQEPDARKQKLLLQFQDEFNKLDHDVRGDPVVKGELHHRLKELRDSIWTITEERKSTSSEELTSTQKQQWLNEFQVFITRQHMQLVQLEVNRYLHTAKFLTDFYLEKNSQAPPIDAGVFEGLFVDVIGEDTSSKKKKAPPAKKGKGASEDTYEPEIPANLEDTLTRAKAVVDIPINQANDKKGKGAKKKGKGSSAEEPGAIPELEEAIALEKKLFLQKLDTIQRVYEQTVEEVGEHKNHVFGVFDKWVGERYQSEMNATRNMVLFVENHIERALPLENELRLSDDEFGVDEYVRIAPSNQGEEAQEEDPSLQPPEKASVDFSYRQMHSLVSKFRTAAPTGFISSADFVTLFVSLCASSFGTADLPDKWLHASRETFEQMAQSVAIPDGSQIINWREFLVNVLMARYKSAPSPQELLCTLASVAQQQPESEGEDPETESPLEELTREQFSQVSFWFASRRPSNNCMSPEEVVSSLFDILAQGSGDEARISLRIVLLYASLDVVPIKSIKNGMYIMCDGSSDEGVNAQQLFTLFNFNLPVPMEEFGLDQMEAIFEEYSHRRGHEDKETLTYEEFCDTAFGRSFIQQADHLRRKEISL